jgi:release factor glutamine methyltransferase
MTLGQALQQATTIFSTKKIEDAHIEARVLLGHVLKLSAAQLYTEAEQDLNKEQENSLRGLIERRLRKEPVAYIINHKEFYGLDFYVDHRVLVPRPETELLVEEALKFAKCQDNKLAFSDKPLLIADIGTGCGNIAICLALNITNIKIFAIDISPTALEVASLNCEHHKVTGKITLLRGDLLEHIIKPVDLIIANLPYIKSSELDKLNSENAIWEPRVALDGGKEGLKQISRLLKQAKEKNLQGCCLLIEIGKGQEYSVVKLTNQYLPNATVELIPDLNKIKRVLKINI